VSLSGPSHLSIKFAVYPGLPKMVSVVAISGDGAVQVLAGEVLFLLPDSVDLERAPERLPRSAQKGAPHQLTRPAIYGKFRENVPLSEAQGPSSSTEYPTFRA
jgi:hypothetical protein